ncbi:MAG: NnrS family protein [Usitatibacter sp.]
MVIFSLGFRAMYALAGAFAAISIPLWVAQYTGVLSPGAAYAGALWHAHEMVFGYAAAVIVGFLFTAGRNWSGQPTPSGAPLAAIAALWLAARLLAFTRWAWASAFFDVAFALAAAAGLGRALWRGRNSRNYFFVALLVAMAALNAAFHLALAGRIDVDLPRIIVLALDIVLFICVVMAGRVVPMFTNNAVPVAGARRIAWLEKLSLGSVLALAAADVASLAPAMIAFVATVAALAHAARLALWHPWRTRAKPILWILHAAYAWVPVHLALRAAAALGYAAPGLASHALAVGVIGGLTIGMMTRTSRGHSGRPLTVGAAEVAAYTLVMAAAAARVLVPLAFPEYTLQGIVVAAALWSAAFATFTVSYWPVLARPALKG